MNNYIITFGFHTHEGFDGFNVATSKPIPASCEEEAADIFRDAIECMEGRECEIHSIKLINS
jgi:hypothetical protein